MPRPSFGVQDRLGDLDTADIAAGVVNRLCPAKASAITKEYLENITLELGEEYWDSDDDLIKY